MAISTKSGTDNYIKLPLNGSITHDCNLITHNWASFYDSWPYFRCFYKDFLSLAKIFSNIPLAYGHPEEPLAGERGYAWAHFDQFGYSVWEMFLRRDRYSVIGWRDNSGIEGLERALAVVSHPLSRKEISQLFDYRLIDYHQNLSATEPCVLGLLCFWIKDSINDMYRTKVVDFGASLQSRNKRIRLWNVRGFDHFWRA